MLVMTKGRRRLDAADRESPEKYERRFFELMERYNAGEFANLEGMSTEELKSLHAEISDVLQHVNEAAHLQETRELAFLSGRALNIVRDRESGADVTKKRNEQNNKLQALIEFGKAVRDVSEWLDVPYDREVAERRRVRDFSETAARESSDNELREVMREFGPSSIDIDKRWLKKLNRCVSDLELLDGLDVASMLSDMRSYRDHVAGIVDRVERNYMTAKGELDAREAKRAEEERIRANLPNVVSELQEQVRMLTRKD